MIVTRAKKKTQTASGTGSILVVMTEPLIDDPGQQGRDRHPKQLVPIEERKAEKPWLDVIIEGNPEEPDIGE
jgi:hypothetical protein